MYHQKLRTLSHSLEVPAEAARFDESAGLPVRPVGAVAGERQPLGAPKHGLGPRPMRRCANSLVDQGGVGDRQLHVSSAHRLGDL